MTEPAVSVIIPTYNRTVMVCEAVDSVLAQGFSHFELVVVDDGSSDGTAERLHSYGSLLRVIRREKGGVSAARNSGIAATKAPLVAFLDSDDLWHPEKLAVQISYMNTFPLANISHTEEIWIRRGRRVNPRERHAKAEGKAFIPLLRESLISPSAVMIRRPVLEEAGCFDESLPACEDYALWLHLSRSQDIHLIHRPLVTKRGGHGDQLSRTLWGLDRFRISVLRRLADDPSLGPGESAEVRTVLTEKCRILAAGSDSRGRPEEAESYRSLAAGYAP